MYQTSNIFLSAFICENGVTMENAVVEPDRQVVVFSFKLEHEQSTKLKREYFSGRGVVSCLRFTQRLKTLKRIVYNLTGERI